MSFKVQHWNEPLPPDQSKLRKQLESEGYTVTEWSDSPGTVHERHSHSDDQTHWIISGTLAFEVDGEKYLLSKGDRDFLPANTEHAAFVPGSEPVRYLIGVKSR